MASNRRSTRSSRRLEEAEHETTALVDTARFATLLRAQATMLPHWLRLVCLLVVLLLFVALAVSETAGMADGQRVLAAVQSSIEGAVWDESAQSTLHNVGSENDVYSFLHTALLPLLQDSNKEWYGRTSFSIEDDATYAAYVDDRADGDEAPNSGYPVWKGGGGTDARAAAPAPAAPAPGPEPAPEPERQLSGTAAAEPTPAEPAPNTGGGAATTGFPNTGAAGAATTAAPNTGAGAPTTSDADADPAPAPSGADADGLATTTADTSTSTDSTTTASTTATASIGYATLSAARIRKYNTATLVQLWQSRGSRERCDRLSFIPGEQASLLGECFNKAEATVQAPSWDEVFTRGLKQQIEDVQVLTKPNSSLALAPSAMFAHFPIGKLEKYAAEMYGQHDAAGRVCADPEDVSASLPPAPGRCSDSDALQRDNSSEAECFVQWNNTWMGYSVSARLFEPTRPESPALAVARSACYALSKSLLSKAVEDYFKLKSNTDESGVVTAQDQKVGLVYLSMLDAMEANQAVVSLLQQHAWIDVATRELRVTVQVYNANHKLFVMCTLAFDFDTGGNANVESSYTVVPMAKTTNMSLAWLCVAALALMVAAEAQQVLGAALRCLRTRSPSPLLSYFGEENIIDLAVIVLGFLTVSAYASGEAARQAFQFPESLDVVSDPQPLVKCINSLTEMALLNQGAYELAGLCLLTMFVKSSNALSFHPKFGILCKMLRRSGSDIGHFLVMFSFFFVGYAFFAHFLFGTHLKEYATPANAIISSFNILLGEFDVEALTAVGRGWTYFFFYSFNVLLLWILLNVFIAICSDAYASVKAESQESQEHGDFHTTRMLLLGGKALNRAAAHLDGLVVGPADRVGVAGADADGLADGGKGKLLTPLRLMDELRQVGIPERWVSHTLIRAAGAHSSQGEGAGGGMGEAELARRETEVLRAAAAQRGQAALLREMAKSMGIGASMIENAMPSDDAPFVTNPVGAGGERGTAQKQVERVMAVKADSNRAVL
jgi:hypothetical protein